LQSLVDFVNGIIEIFEYGQHGQPTHSDKTMESREVEDDVVEEINYIGKIKCR